MDRTAALELLGVPPDADLVSFGTAFAVDMGAADTTCSSERRCPGLRVDAGGAVRFCADRLSGCP